TSSRRVLLRTVDVGPDQAAPAAIAGVANRSGLLAPAKENGQSAHVCSLRGRDSIQQREIRPDARAPGASPAPPNAPLLGLAAVELADGHSRIDGLARPPIRPNRELDQASDSSPRYSKTAPRGVSAANANCQA